MKKTAYLFLIVLLTCCTSNTILKVPKDLIPKDTMSLLVQEMMIASSSKYIKNKNLEKKIEYMALVYDRFKIDSTRFKISNEYYMSKIDEYQDIFEDARENLENQKKIFEEIINKKDSIKIDSMTKVTEKSKLKIKDKDHLNKLDLK